MYSDAEAAALYDVLNPWGPGDDFYLSLSMAARAVLDIGCGTGTMLHRARSEGHVGRLVGIDPDRNALALARRRSDIEWVEGTAASMDWNEEFDLAVMMSHAFQFLVSDDELRASLAAIRRALVDGGRFAFETRNPAAREWERWTPDNPIEVVDPAGRELLIAYRVESVDGDVVTFTETTCDRAGTPMRVDRARLRFLSVYTLSALLADAGFAVESLHGGWQGEVFRDASAEIVTCARRA